MKRALSVLTAATSYPVSLTEAKNHLKVDTTEDDTLITNLIVAATQSCEIYTNQFFIETEVKQYCDYWDDAVQLYKSPVSDIVVIKYYDSTNTYQTLSASVYLSDLESEPARIALDVNQSFPTLANRINAVEVRYKVGYGDAASDVPDGIKQAILLTIGNWYGNRESVITGRTATEVPQTSKFLLDQYKIQVC
jgi:uncharacterized phiE125 gp8 family phage protein